MVALRLAGQTCYLTGGGSGLGRALVAAFINNGARVGVLEKNADKCAELEKDFGADVVVFHGDVRSYQAHERCVALTERQFGPINTYIGNAAIWDHSKPLRDLGSELGPAFHEIFEVNVLGYLHGARATLHSLRAGCGNMVFTVSNAGFHPGGGGVLYTGSKHAVVGVIKQLAYELAPRVRVNGVAVGAMDSDLRGPDSLGLGGKRMLEGRSTEDLARLLPIQRLPRPEEYTGFYVTLASSHEAGPATGSIVICDGGVGVRGLRAVAGDLDHSIPAQPPPWFYC